MPPRPPADECPLPGGAVSFHNAYWAERIYRTGRQSLPASVLVPALRALDLTPEHPCVAAYRDRVVSWLRRPRN